MTASTNQGLSGVDLDRLRGPLRALYAELDAEVARRNPVCRVSGRCCRFVEYDHTLFLSGLEAAVLVADAPEPCRPLDHGATCPWQDSRNRCTAREARPLGCRVYFCDPAYEAQAPELSEVYLGRLKALAGSLGLAWDYAPLHDHLGRAAADGRFPAVPADRTGEPSRPNPAPERPPS